MAATIEEMLRARMLVGAARDFLSGHSDAVTTVSPTLEFEAGALYALEWALGVAGHRAFADHLTALERIHKDLIAVDS
jgi:hypothetical protein